MYLLDTNILAEIIKQNPKIVEKLRDFEEEIALCTIVQAECFFGAKKLKRKNLIDVYESLFESFPCFSFDYKACEIFTDIKAILSNSRKMVANFDLMIASICLANNATLVTHNTKDFKSIPGIVVEDWV